MMLFDALQILLEASFPLPSVDSNSEQLSKILQRMDSANEILAQNSLYAALSPDEGRSLALLALALSEKNGLDDRFRFVPNQVLENIANAVPGALAGLYPRFLLRNFAYGTDSLFRETDAITRDQLLAWIENEEKTVYSRQELLALVSWIDDELIPLTFQRWRETSPAWANDLLMPVEWFTLCAGWELTAGGKRRNYHIIEKSWHGLELLLEREIPGIVLDKQQFVYKEFGLMIFQREPDEATQALT